MDVSTFLLGITYFSTEDPVSTRWVNVNGSPSTIDTSVKRYLPWFGTIVTGSKLTKVYFLAFIPVVNPVNLGSVSVAGVPVGLVTSKLTVALELLKDVGV